MKIKAILLTLAIMIAGISFGNTINESTSSDEQKKVLKKIKRKMQYVNMDKYIEEGQQANLLVTCKINKQNKVEVININGKNQELKKEIISILEDHPVLSKSELIDSSFTFTMKFDYRAAN